MRVRFGANIYHSERAVEAAKELAFAEESLVTLREAIAKRSPEFQKQVNTGMPELEGYFKNARDLLNRYAEDPNTTDEQWAVLVEGCRALRRVCEGATASVEAAAGGDEVLNILRKAGSALESLFPWWLTAGLAVGIGLLIYNSLRRS